ncbi:sel1 repeat family protein [Deltaproteobacteria bacterium OttesenSCG-928-K17]|nr:sel1 repeat family protein [Deltaproteobacteria bacterium OttesenSCG-928-K17]
MVRIVYAALICMALLCGPVVSSAQAQGPGVDLFFQGRYAEAYAALWPNLSAGQPEAAFYGLIIRRNGLDGRAPAQAREMAALWRILNDQAGLMRSALSDAAVPALTKDAYRTALAQLEYFGPVAPAWPPPKRSGRAAGESWPAATSIGATVQRFTPAMNFQAYLDLQAYEGRETSAFNHSLKAAEQGDHLAMANVARLYRLGLGRPKNNLRAAHWARRSCAASPPTAQGQNELGACYELGRGVTMDLNEAARWYKGAADQGYEPAKANSLRLKNRAGDKAGLNGAAEPRLAEGVLF